MMECYRSHLYKVVCSILISLHYATGLDNANCNFDGLTLCRWQNYDVMISLHAPPDSRGEWSTQTGSSKADIGHSSHFIRLVPTGDPGAVQERAEGLMLSPVMSALPASTAGCLEFDYFLYGQPEDQIDVYYLDNQLLSGPLVWRVNGTYDGVWQFASIPFRYNKPFQFAIHGIISGHDAGTIIAIDDVRYTVSSASCHLNPLSARADDTNQTLTMQGMMTPAPPTIPTTTPKPSDCRDDPNANCWSRPGEDCFGLYEAWSRSHCPSRCGFCPEPPPCEDVLARCDQFPSSTCNDSQYALWARTQCRKTCHKCDVPTRPITTTVATTTTTVDPNGCYDNPNATCWSRQDDACFGNYESWARANCKLRCGFCTNYAAFCVDSMAHCDQYTRETCTDPNYQWWARTNCRKYCDMCHLPTHPPTGTTLPTPPPTCQYKGSIYYDGALWEDGCEYHCYCNAGRTVCNDKCLTLEVPPTCVRSLTPGLCCPIYTCPPGVMPRLPVG